MKARLLTFILIAFFSTSANSEGIPPETTSDAAALAETQWVDSVFQRLSVDERIGQLFMIRAHSNLGADHIAKVEKLVKESHVGGLCFFQGTPEKQAELTN